MLTDIASSFFNSVGSVQNICRHVIVSAVWCSSSSYPSCRLKDTNYQFPGDQQSAFKLSQRGKSSQIIQKHIGQMRKEVEPG